MEAILQPLINGVLCGGTYALLAVGTTLIFGVMRMVNFANGSMLMVGMYLTWWAWDMLGWNIYALIPIVVLMLAIIAYICYKIMISPILMRERTSVIIVTVGLSYALQNLVTLIFGATPLNVPSNLRYSSLIIGDLALPWIRIIAFTAAVVLTILFNILIAKTSYGRCMRATSENVEVAEMLGINTKSVFISAWIIGTILMGISGLLLAPLYNITPAVGNVFRSTALIAVVLGGLSDIRGAFISGIMLGIVEQFVNVYVNPQLGVAGMMILYLVILQIKPLGLFGKGERVG